MTREEAIETLANLQRASFAKYSATPFYEAIDMAVSALREQEANQMALKAACSTLVQYIKAEKEGRLLLLPVKVGDTVWFIRPLETKPKITETTVEKVVKKSKGVFMKLDCNAMYETSCTSIGKTVFLNREEAEAKLRRLEEV